MQEQTLFQKIHARSIPATILYEDDEVFAIRDIDPKAPVHILVIPIKPIPSLAAAGPEDAGLLAGLLLAAQRIAAQENLAGGWRLVANTGADAGQSVPHLHFHLLGGRRMGWPPG